MPDKKKPTPTQDVYTISIDELKSRVAKALDSIQQIREQFHGTPNFTSDDRTHSNGHWHKGEPAALLPVLNVTDVIPGLFNSLASDDEGNDPNAFESELIKDRVERAAVIEPLDAALDSFAHTIRDFSLDLGEKTRPVMLAAYKLAKPHVKHNPKVRDILATTVDFFSKLAQKNTPATPAKPAK